jgi:hypothetical protein
MGDPGNAGGSAVRLPAPPFRALVLSAALAGGGAAPAISGLVVAQQRDRTWTVTGDRPIEIRAPNRTIAVRGWERPALRVRWTKEGDGDRMEARLDSDIVRLGLDAPEPAPEPGRGDTLYVMVPSAANLYLKSTYGGITVDSVGGRVEMETYRGGGAYRGGATDVTVTTYFGDILVEAPRCRTLTVESGLGSVVADVRGGRIRARTLRGDIRLTARDAVDHLDAESTAGSIHVRGTVSRDGRISLDSHQGPVRLALPQNVDATFQLRTYSGAIENAFGPSHAAVHAPSGMTAIRFQWGGGGARIELGSFLGTLRLEVLRPHP